MGFLREQTDDRVETIRPFLGLGFVGDFHVGLLHVLDERRRHVSYRQHIIDQPCRYCAARHGVELGRLRLLRHNHAAGAPDLPCAQRPVRSAARKKHANRPLALILSKGAKKKVNRHAHPVALDRLGQVQPAFGEPKKLIGGYRVNGIGVERHLIFGLDHTHVRDFGQKLRHVTHVARVQVLDHHESHAVVGGHSRKKFF